jgi:hypothetical protein
MQSDLIQRDAALAKRFGPMGIVIDGKLAEARETWLGVMATATNRYNEWGRFEDDDAFHYACERVREIDQLIRDLAAEETADDFASLAAIRAITEGDVQADWKAYCRKSFDLDEPAHYVDLHTGAMADPSYDPRRMKPVDLALYIGVGAVIWVGAIISLFAYLR